jgi:branched-chain amino acid aminotransferase
MTNRIYVGDRFHDEGAATVSVFDHGLLYGDGVFEGIRAYNGRVFKLERHIQRLFDSAKALRLTIPASAADLTRIILEACAVNDIVDGYIRVVVTRGPGDLGIDPRSCRGAQLIVIARPSLALYRSGLTGVAMITSSFRRPPPDTVSPGIKSLNYVNNVLARMEANDRGADEALMLDVNGFVAEATADNIFIVTGGRLATPPTATNLKGITRETVLEIARAEGLDADERPFTLFDVWTADEVFVCGTGAEIIPVLTVDSRPIGDGGVGSVTGRIVEGYAALVRSSGTAIPGRPDRAVPPVAVVR